MLSQLKTGLSNILSNKKFILIIFFVLILIGVSIYTYQTYIIPRLNPSFVPNKEFIQKTEEDVTTATLYYFCVDWCPYCKKPTPVVESIKKQYESQKINGIQLNVISADCTNDDSPVTSFENQHNVKIDGYPTIYIVKGQQVIEYDAKVNKNTLTEFLNTVL